MRSEGGGSGRTGASILSISGDEKNTAGCRCDSRCLPPAAAICYLRYRGNTAPPPVTPTTVACGSVMSTVSGLAATRSWAMLPAWSATSILKKNWLPTSRGKAQR